MLTRIAAIACCLALIGCGGGKSGVTDAINHLPKCSAVWVVGKTLPKSYEGCKNDAGALVPALNYDCKDGTKLTSSDKPKAFARFGGKIQASTDATYSAEFDKCKGL